MLRGWRQEILDIISGQWNPDYDYKESYQPDKFRELESREVLIKDNNK